MSITVTCSSCAEPHRLREDAVGKRFKCKKCNKIQQVKVSAALGDDIPDFANANVAAPQELLPATARDKRLKQQLFGTRLSSVLFAAVFVGFSVWQLNYLIFGKTAVAKVNHKATEWRSSRGGSHEVVVLEYSFQSPDGDYRSGSDTLPAGWQPATDGSVTVEYLPLVRLASRVKGSNERFLWFVPIFTGLLSAILGGVSLIQARRLSLPARPQESLQSNGTPRYSQGALVSQWIGFFGQPVTVIVDRAAGQIHFQNCHWLRKFLVFRATPWFSCPVGEVRSAIPVKSKGNIRALKIVTKEGSAWISADATNFQSLYNELGL
jgi:hypothetical protein